MIISNKLSEFYRNNNLAIDGGEKDSYFYLKFKLFKLKLPNSDFRKKVVYIHDIQHILYDCDVTWKGEAFIAGWEIATDIWKYFPLGIMSLWATGFSFLLHPKEVFRGYKQGLLCNGVIDLKISKKEILNLSISDVKNLIKRKQPKQFNWFVFLFWILTAELVVFLPLILSLIIVYFFAK